MCGKRSVCYLEKVIELNQDKFQREILKERNSKKYFYECKYFFSL